MARAEPVHITKIEIVGIRGFRDLDLNVQSADGSPRLRTLIIGKNGTGKSTLLRSLVLCLLPGQDSLSLLNTPLGRLEPSGELGEIELGIQQQGASRRFSKSFGILAGGLDGSISGTSFENLNGSIFICGYGAGRYGTKTEPSPGYRASAAVSSLFRYEQALLDPELTLYRLKSVFGSDIYDRTLLGLKRALGLTEADDIAPRKGGGIEVFGPSVGGTIPFESWADGYRLTFSWILDLYGWAMQAEAIDEEGHVEGILLIDEIEQHLHPSMQAEILPRLSELFPKMQIFATTHSPLVALDARPEELVVLRREGDQVVAVQEVPDFAGYSVEDMLADPRIFDSEVYGSEMRDRLGRYRELAAVPRAERGPVMRGELHSLATELRSLETYSEQENETSKLLKGLVAKYDL